MARIIDFIRSIPAGTGVNGVSVLIKRHSDNTTVTTLTSDSAGRFTYNVDGSPGPVYASASTGDRVRVRSGKATGQIGTYYGADVPVALRALGDGVIRGYSDPEVTAGDMAVTPGTGLQVSVAEGALLIDGHVYRCSAATPLSISANSAGATRYDRVVVEFTREGQTEEGKCVLKISAGTAGAGAPASLVSSNATKQVALATITVANGASSIISDNIADTRRYSVSPGQLEVRNGGDIVAYSDDGVTAKATLDGATGNLTLSGTLTTTRVIGETTILPVIIDGSGAAIAAGVKLDLPVPYNGTITGWDVMANESGSIVVDLWKDTYANYPPTVADTMTGADKPTLASVQKATKSGLTWAVTQGDVIRVNVDSATTVTRVLVALKVTKA
jgi:hypothetical protein